MYEDNQTKFACVLNSRTPLPRALNAAFHALIGLMGRLTPENAELLDYPFKGGNPTSLISRHPVIVLQARNGNQLRTLLAQAADRKIHANLFASSMLGASAADQQAQTWAVGIEDADVFAVALFGAASEIDPLTRKFSVFRCSEGETDNAAG
ncbi:MAG: DUF2000 domain-containing protein [Sphingomonas sp.]